MLRFVGPKAWMTRSSRSSERASDLSNVTHARGNGVPGRAQFVQLKQMPAAGADEQQPAAHAKIPAAPGTIA